MTTTRQLKDEKLISQGAEGRVYRGTFFGRRTIVKERFIKKYRHPSLDKRLNSRRMNSEVRIMQRLGKVGIRAPTPLFLDIPNLRIYMEEILGKTVKEILWESDQGKEELMKEIGSTLAVMHNNNVIHGDLTTSNMIYEKELVLIDFGLSHVSALVEDKAVDLYVLERAFRSTHPRADVLFSVVLKEYEMASNDSKAIMSKLEKVRQRGRKMSMVG